MRLKKFQVVMYGSPLFQLFNSLSPKPVIEAHEFFLEKDESLWVFERITEDNKRVTVAAIPYTEGQYVKEL